MQDAKRGRITRIIIEIDYGDADTHREVIEGERLDGLSALAFDEESIGACLADDNDRDEALRAYRHGFREPGRGLPALMRFYGGGRFVVECDRESHQPPAGG